MKHHKVKHKMIDIAVVNTAKNLNNNDLANYVAAYVVQANEHFGPAHDILPVNIYITDNPQPTDWVLGFFDNIQVAGALGYHDVTPTGLPLAKIGVDTTLQDGASVSVVGSHELLEMLGDPLIIACMQVSNTMIYAFEMCDAPEADNYGYTINGVLVSDFIYSSWFATEKSGPYDYEGHIQKPLEILPGGYIGALDISNTNGWIQLTNSVKLPSTIHSGQHGTRFDKRIRAGGLRRSTY